MNKRFFLRGAFALVLSSLAMAQGVLAAPTATVPLQVSPERATTMAVWEPAQVRGVVLFSSGHGSWPERYDGVLTAWRDAGFAVVAPLHVDSVKYPEREKFSMQQGFGERLADMKAASGYVAARWPGVPVAAGGHSYGTLISLALGGAMADMAPLRDPSVIAVIGYSSPGRIPGLVTPTTYASVAVPVLIVTGDQDLVPGFVSDAKDHLYPVETAPAGGKVALVLTGGGHNLIGSDTDVSYARARDVGTAFLQAEVLGNANAAKVLAADDSEAERWIRR
ncbi:alpha/beta hydrolase [Pseudoxanthomonas sp. PXM01]|uniref:alpha/beta hydrolase family protein n=1 Tax=Pseudoxanthomonas sp. PXM01 TaxID=2769295 RepID=UPI00177C0480|nr:alpha/beta hydrolase [Pseudoxanthomonas sp. PXM01]MBD9468527.1 alpha/beta hydrolase [Pseudoxanthomonas sp. PXM01]